MLSPFTVTFTVSISPGLVPGPLARDICVPLDVTIILIARPPSQTLSRKILPRQLYLPSHFTPHVTPGKIAYARFDDVNPAAIKYFSRSAVTIIMQSHNYLTRSNFDLMIDCRLSRKRSIRRSVNEKRIVTCPGVIGP